eukprot:scaffold139738_cov30-Tisochrysis_lutea.AAC.2
MSPSELTPKTLSPPEPLRSDFSPPIIRACKGQQAVFAGPEIVKRPSPDCVMTDTGMMISTSLDAQLSPTEQMSHSPQAKNPRISLCFDPQLNCYFDPVTHKYFELSF